MRIKKTYNDMFSLLIIIFIAMSGLMGIDLYLSSMPSMTNYMNTDKWHMQQSITLYLLGLLAVFLYLALCLISMAESRLSQLVFFILLSRVGNYICR